MEKIVKYYLPFEILLNMKYGTSGYVLGYNCKVVIETNELIIPFCSEVFPNLDTFPKNYSFIFFERDMNGTYKATLETPVSIFSGMLQGIKQADLEALGTAKYLTIPVETEQVIDYSIESPTSIEEAQDQELIHETSIEKELEYLEKDTNTEECFTHKKLSELYILLNKAVVDEKYEQAARLRDEIGKR